MFEQWIYDEQYEEMQAFETNWTRIMRFKDEVDLMCIVLGEQFEIKSHLVYRAVEEYHVGCHDRMGVRIH